MSRKNQYAIGIHRTEWERIQRQAKTTEEPEEDDKKHIQDLIDLSRKWISSWPDTELGHISKLKKDVKKNKVGELAEIKESIMKTMEENSVKTIKKARELIFENSCYGKQLISALLESSAIEIREAQIKFKKEIKNKEDNLEKSEMKSEKPMYFDLYATEQENNLREKLCAIENSKINKALAESNKHAFLKEKKSDEEARMTDARIMQKLQELEDLEKEQRKALEKQGIKAYEEENKAIYERRLKREAFDEATAQVWRKYHDRVRCRELQVFNQIHKEHIDTGRFKENYKLVKKLQQEQESKINDFINKGVEICKQRLLNKEKEEKQKKEEQRQREIAEAKYNKEYGEKHEILQASTNKNICDRQSLLLKHSRDKKTYRPSTNKDSTKKMEFLTPSKNLVQSWQHRKSQAPGWSGANEAHAQFAEHAGRTLAECKHKNMARKVVDDYRKDNHLDTTTLQISNY